MSGDEETDLPSSIPFSFTGPVPPFFTRSHYRTSSTFSPGTPTDFPPSTPTLSTSFDVNSPPALTQTGDPTATDEFPSSTGTLSTPTPTSTDPDPSTLTSTDVSSSVTLPPESSSSSVSPFGSSLSIDPSTTSTLLSDLSSPTSIPNLSTSTSSDDSISSISSVSSDTWLTTEPSSTPDPTLTTSSSSLTTSSPSLSLTPSTSLSTSPSSSTSTPVSSPTRTTSRPTSSTIPLSQVSSLRSSPSSVTTTAFPSFGGGGSPQSRTSTTGTGAIVAATTGAIALAIVLALLAILCRKRFVRKQRNIQDPFLDLDPDGDTVAVNQPLIVGDAPAPVGAAFADPFTDESRQRTRSRNPSVTTGATGLARSNNSFQAVVGSMPTPGLGGSFATGYYNQNQFTDRRSPPRLPPSGITRTRSPSVQSSYPPEFPVPRSPSFDAGAIAYLRRDGQVDDLSPPSPGRLLPGSTEDHKLMTAFSVASGLSPRFSAPVPPPPNIDETWRNSPEPIAASSSYRLPSGRRPSFTPSVGGQEYEPGDTIVIGPMNVPNRGPAPYPYNDDSDMSALYDTQDENHNSRPSPITEVTEIPSHSHEGSGNTGGTWNSYRTMDSTSSMPVVMHAQRVHLTPTALSIVTPRTPSTGSHLDEPFSSTGSVDRLPPVPPLPPSLLPKVQPLSLGKKRSAQAVP